MKLNHKHQNATLLALVLFISQLAGCGDTSNHVTGDTQTDSFGSSSYVQTTEASKPDLPDDLDFDNTDFTILYPGAAISMKYSFSEQNGDVLSDTLYERNLAVNEALNVNIIPYALNALNVNQSIEKSVMSGDESYQMVLTHSTQGVSAMVTSGLLMDWNDISYVDFDKPWWNAEQTDELTLNGKSYYATGSLLVPNPVVLFFNKNIVSEYKLESPYDLVRDGKWTLDKMIELSIEVSNDTDGNNIYDDKDTYGYVGEVNWKVASYMFAAGQKITERDNDGSVKLAMNTERMQTIIEKLDKLYHGGTYSYSTNQNANELSVMFQNGQALFYLEAIVNAEQYRTTNVDFGILPLPKLNESQDSYYALSWTGFMAIPMNTDPELAGAVSELLCYESLVQVQPVYYDTLLDSKIARDEESTEMLDIIFDNYISDMGMNYELSSDLLYAAHNMLTQKTTGFASYYAKYETSALSALERLLKSVE